MRYLLAILLVVLLSALGIFMLFRFSSHRLQHPAYAGPQPELSATASTSAYELASETADALGNSLTQLYDTPFGFRVDVPLGFRVAKTYMNFFGTSSTPIILTTASDEQEKAYVSEIRLQIAENSRFNPIGDPDSFPNQAIYINEDPEAFPDVQASVYQMADPKYRNDFEEQTGTPYPLIVSDLAPLPTKRGTEGIMYVEKAAVEDPSSTPYTVDADVPNQSLSELTIDIVFPITSSGSIPFAEAAIRHLVASLEFN